MNLYIFLLKYTTNKKKVTYLLLCVLLVHLNFNFQVIRNIWIQKYPSQHRLQTYSHMQSHSTRAFGLMMDGKLHNDTKYIKVA